MSASRESKFFSWQGSFGFFEQRILRVHKARKSQNNTAGWKNFNLSEKQKSGVRISHTANIQLAGVLGFEPRDNGVRVRCLTAWRYPSENHKTYYSIFDFRLQVFFIFFYCC